MQKDLLREAIADAKAVRQTALANAKLALEEAFTPRLQSMLSAKLSEELSDDEETTNEWQLDDYADNTPTFSEGEEHEADDMDDMDDDAGNDEDEDDLDLDEIIRELEEEENTDSMYEEGMDDETEMHEEGMDDETEMDEDIDINEIINSLREMQDDQDTEMDEDIDINEIIRALSEEEDEGKPWAEPESADGKSGDLEEAYDVIRFLKDRINEVNLLNAKLLYSNKLFRGFNLNETQKMKVIENFDRAHTLREVKLVYSTLAEGFNVPTPRKVVKESYASRPVASTRPATQHIISEGTELANRFKKLAGLTKN
jgi:hypothetical protein